jgi:ankyrin repeat protein
MENEMQSGMDRGPADAKMARLESELFFAACEGREDLAEALVRQGALGRHRGWLRDSTPLHEAAIRDNARMAEILLPVSDAKAVDSGGKSALMLAAGEDALACLRLLLPWSDPDAVDSEGVDALAIAAGRGAAKCVQALLGVSDAQRRDKAGKTPLMRAAWAEGAAAAKVIRALLPGSDAAARDREGKTALIHAVMAWHPANNPSLAAVEALAQACEIEAEDDAGQSALSLAREKWQEPVAAALGRWLRVKKDAEAIREEIGEAEREKGVAAPDGAKKARPKSL